MKRNRNLHLARLAQLVAPLQDRDAEASPLSMSGKTHPGRYQPGLGTLLEEELQNQLLISWFIMTPPPKPELIINPAWLFLLTTSMINLATFGGSVCRKLLPVVEMAPRRNSHSLEQTPAGRDAGRSGITLFLSSPTWKFWQFCSRLPVLEPGSFYQGTFSGSTC